MEKKLLVLGAGQYGAVIKELALTIGNFIEIAFLDDAHENGTSQEHTIGKMQDYKKLVDEYDYAIPAIGNAVFRMELLRKLEDAGYKVPTLVSPQAYVAPSAELGKGVVIEPLAGVHAHAEIGAGSYVSMGAVVNHNAIVGEGCHIDNNAVVMSAAVVESNLTTKPCEVIRKKYK